MRLFADGNIWAVESSYQEKDAVKAAGFRWDPKEKRWWTNDRERAAKLVEFADDSCRAELTAAADTKAVALAASRAASSDAEFPAPDGLSYLPYQRAGIAYALERPGCLIGDDMGLGKAQPLDAKVLTPGGWKMMGDIRVGDFVVGANGKPARVIGVFPQGKLNCYSVTFSDGSSTECCDEHLWEVCTARDRWAGGHPSIKTLGEIRESLRHENGNSVHFIPIVEPVEFAPTGSLPIHPYVLGALVGDGGITQQVRFSSVDEEIVQRIAVLLPPNVEIKRVPNTRCDYNITSQFGNRWSPNPITRSVREMGLACRSEKKFIPEQYKLASVTDRLELLRGLMDTDGTIGASGTAQFDTTSTALADDFVFLVRSLGGTTRKSCRSVSYKNRAGEKVQGKPSFRITVSLPHTMCPFHLPRKADLFSRTKYPPARAFRTVELVGRKQMQCIKVDAQDQLYVTDDFIVTHNTIQGIGVINADASIRSVLVICPASLKLNWKKELTKWLVRPATIGIANGTFPDTDIVAINFDILAKHHDAIRARSWDLLIVDEAHALKNPDTIRTQQVIGRKEKKKKSTKGGEPKVVPAIAPIAARRRVFMTGTPICNRPKELWPLVSSLDPDGLGKSWWSFAQRYCGANHGRFGWDFSGSSHLDELQEKLRTSIMVRRTKSQVLTELPPKRRQIIEMPANGARQLIEAEGRVWKLHEDALADLRARVELAKASDDPAVFEGAVKALTKAAAVAFDEISKCRHDVALAKVPHVVEHLRDAIESSGKVVLFCHHRDMVEAISAEFPGAAIIHGGIAKIDERQAAVERFQSDPCCQLFIGTIGAAGVGHTLTAASHVVFAELDWTPGLVTQAEDRCVLPGQLVMTPSGWKTVESVANGDAVVNSGGQATSVTDVWSKHYDGEAVEVAVYGWRLPLRLTVDHRVLLSNGEWQEAGCLKRGDRIATPHGWSGVQLDRWEFPQEMRTPEFTSSGKRKGRLKRAPQYVSLTEDWLFLLGYYAADGSAKVRSDGNGHYICLSGASNGRKAVALARCKETLERIGVNSKWIERGNMVELFAYSSDWARWFRSAFGHGASNKKMPDFVNNLSIEQKEVVLRGLLCGDGSVRRMRQRFSSRSSALASWVANTAAQLGETPCVALDKRGDWSVEWTPGKRPRGLFVKEVKTFHYQGPVYDLTVQERESFVLGTAVVHNCHRLGQTDTVLVQHLVLEGSLDAKMAQTLVNKQNVIDAALDKHHPARVEMEKLVVIPGAESATERTSRKQVEEEAVHLTPAQVEAIHQGLRVLAGFDVDFAQSRNGMGFSKIDVRIGHSLAEAPFLSPRQAALGKRIVTKYRRQLPADLSETIQGWQHER